MADLRTVFKNLDLSEIMMVGFQMGGTIAAHYVTTQEEKRVTRLVLCAAALPALAASPGFPYGAPPFVFDSY